ncbi:TIGR04222 domain-containing membrane protein [Streptomyces sp. NBC_00250]|uniref:TIGR04222 domain-containing membrane protein n=1 Tax=Streptomyces sp. NBC_00250 TaxID=2903641 RepID=UPI002E2CF918|nr:TIGR04222 domain-containing membrane protein [Streptomyces sp. NBC_00250]
MATTYHRTPAENIGEALDLYDYAYLAGGERRVVETAIVSLTERGMLTMRAARLRSVGDERPRHPVERAVVAACPRSKRVQEVTEALRHSPEVDELARRLVSLGLVRGRRRRTTRSGRRRLATAASAGGLPAYAREGPAALDPGPVRYGLLSTRTVPDGLGRTLLRMARALDDGPAHTTDSGPDGSVGFGCGAGGGD